MTNPAWQSWLTRGGGALTLLLALGACGGGNDQPTPEKPDPLLRATQYGKIAGIANTEKSTYAWLGVPYAKPPVGALRWMPPASPDDWQETRSAKAFGHSCAQPGSFYAPPKADDGFSRDIAFTFGQQVGSEDCLTLNIWRPASEEKDLPVVVWIHGGANTVGYSSNPGYDGARFARTNNAVVVSVNYRLGVFGWFRHPALKTGDALADSGNFGTLDLLKALEFVNKNIAGFGGDTGNVTVMGQSAGAWNTYAMMLSPLTKGKNLFQKAVPLSMGVKISSTTDAGVYAASVLAKLLVMSGQATAETVQDHIAGMSTAEIAKFLRDASADLLVLLSSGQADNIGDGTVLPADPVAAVAADEYRNVPLLAGMTHDEGKMFLQTLYQVDDAQRFLMMYDFDPDHPDAAGAPTIADVLKPGVTVDTYNAAGAGATASTFAASIDGALKLFQAKQPKTYAYRFDWAQGPEPWKTLYGAGHGMDVPFVFGNFGKGLFSVNYSSANKGGREAVSDAMMRSIGAFMKTGDPNNAALGVTWSPWTPAGTPKRVVFDASLTDKKITAE